MMKVSLELNSLIHALLTVSFVFLWAIVRCFSKDWAVLMPYLFLINQCIAQNLQVRDRFGDLSQDELQDLENKTIISVLSMAAVTQTGFITCLFLLPLIVLPSTYFYLRVQVQIKMDPYSSGPVCSSLADNQTYFSNQLIASLLVIIFVQLNMYITQKDQLQITIKKIMNQRQEVQLTQYLRGSRDAILIACSDDDQVHRAAKDQSNVPQILLHNEVLQNMLGVKKTKRLPPQDYISRSKVQNEEAANECEIVKEIPTKYLDYKIFSILDVEDK